MISIALRRVYGALARPVIALPTSIQRGSLATPSRVAAEGAPLASRLGAARMDMVFRATVLSAHDRADVAAFYEELTDETMSDVRGSRCAFLSGLSGETRDEANRWMATQFDHFLSDGGSLAGACIGLRGKAGKLVGISFMQAVRGLPGVCRTWGLTIADGWQGKGAGTALKLAQLEHASELGFQVAQTILDMSDMKGVRAAEKGAEPIPVMKLLERVSRYGYEMVGPTEWSRESMVISMKLKRSP